MTNLTILSVVWGDYFERFGEEWVGTLEGAGCDQVVLVSDKRVSVPSFVKLIVKDFENPADFYHAGHRAVETEWLTTFGLDDLLLPGATLSVDSNADVYGWPSEFRGLKSGLAAYEGGYENIMDLSYNPMLGNWAYRNELWQEIPFRDYLYLDEVHFCELSYFGKTVEYSSVPRTTWLRHDDAVSMHPNEEATEQVRRFKAKLRAGQIQKGVPE
jgi:hypothetical protein